MAPYERFYLTGLKAISGGGLSVLQAAQKDRKRGIGLVIDYLRASARRGAEEEPCLPSHHSCRLDLSTDTQGATLAGTFLSSLANQETLQEPYAFQVARSSYSLMADSNASFISARRRLALGD